MSFLRCWCFFFISTQIFLIIHAKTHHLDLKDDERHYITVSSFGFQKGGLLTLTALLNITSIDGVDFDVENGGKYGFTIDKTRNYEVATYFEKNQEICIFDADKPPLMDNSTGMLQLEFQINYHNGYPKLKMTKSGHGVGQIRMFSCLYKLKDHGWTEPLKEERETPLDVGMPDVVEILEKYPELANCSEDLPDGAQLLRRGKLYLFSVAFYMADLESEGAYSVVYHNCPNYMFGRKTKTSMSLYIVERNGNEYLSIGERFTPTVYFVFATLFFGTGVIWAWFLRTANGDVFKLHYVMLTLIIFKAISLLCHGINLHFVSKLGAHIEGWAILFYVTHLLKGALLFITLVLIGTGWAFIKNFLTNKEKKIFLIVIPLQVLANLAWTIMEESEAGAYRYTTWNYIFMFIDFFCCGCILIPIVWSIRHLSEAAETDGKAASSLLRMKLFRRFYMLVVCYIYFTRIVVLIFNMTIPFRYTYLNSVFQEGGTFIFFILTGWTFRPTLENPYLRLPQETDDDDDDPDEVEMDDVVVYDQNKMDRVVMRNSATRVHVGDSEKALLAIVEERA